MKSFSILLLGAAIVASGFAAAPQVSGPAIIALIDGDRVLEGSAIGREARQRLEAEAGRWQERITTVTRELETLNRQRQEQALTLNESALARLNREIEEKQVQIQRMNDDARRELQRLEQQITIDVNQKLGPLLERFAADHGFDLILDTSRAQGVLYYSNRRDVTDEFLALIDASQSSPD